MKPAHKRLMWICAIISFIVTVTFMVKLVWFRPFSFNHFLERSYYQLLFQDPEALTNSHLMDDYPIFDLKNELTDPSSDHTKKMNDLGSNILNMLEEYERTSLSQSQRISYDIFHWFLQHNVEGEQFQFYDYPVNQFSGAHLSFPRFMTHSHSVNTLSDAEDYLKRLSLWQSKVSGLIEAMEYRRKINVIPPTGIIDKTIAQCKNIIEKDISNNALYVRFIQQLGSSNEISQKDSARMESSCRTLLFENVYPAYRDLIDYLQLLKKSSTEVHGIWRFENGGSAYRYFLQTHTTLDISPEELYHIGMVEKERIEGRMRILLHEMGYADSLTISESMTMLSKEPRYVLDTSETGVQRTMKGYQQMVDQTYPKLAEFFTTIPEDELSIKRMRPESEKRSSMALYRRDRSGEKGILYVNLGNLEEHVAFRMPTVVYHEAIPGHHLQRSIRLQMKDYPTFRKFLPFTAYTEGWAMYCEGLAEEIGLITEPDEILGMLQMDLFRTVRMLCDIGIHNKKWLREQAIDYMLKNTGLPESAVEREIDRYIVNPGQGCAYKVGQLKMLELRNRMQAELGSFFELKQFHDVVLRNGAVPLDVLGELVDEEIEKLKLYSQTLVPEPI